MRKIVLIEDIARFKANDVVKYMVHETIAGRPADLNTLWIALSKKKFTRAAMREFYQLFGSSVSAYGDVFCTTKQDRKSVAKADERVEKLMGRG